MIYSVHLADAGWRSPRMLLRKPGPYTSPGLAYAEPVITTPLGASSLPRPRLGRVGMIAAWEEDEAIDHFLGDARGAVWAEGWHVRLEAVRVFGSWAAIPGLPSREVPVDDEEPVVVLTLGRLRLTRARPFLRSALPAEREAVGNKALIAGSGLARPPHMVATFSIWRSAAEMREYAFGATGTHQAAVKADRERPFHRESAFIRFRPYASAGTWDGRDPLAAAQR